MTPSSWIIDIPHDCLVGWNDILLTFCLEVSNWDAPYHYFSSCWIYRRTLFFSANWLIIFQLLFCTVRL
jgi:hypothetical protein